MSNSTATVTATPELVQIRTNAIVDGAADTRTVNGGQRDALTGGSCAARSTGASARASILTTLSIPVNATGSPAVSNIARSFCEAGISARDSGRPGGSGVSTGSTQAALTSGGVVAVVTCNGRANSGAQSVSFDVRFQGTYSASTEFRGTFTGARTAMASTSCN